MTFILYFFRDVLHAGNPQAGPGFVAAASLAGSIASALYLGWLSDRIPRKFAVAACGVPMTLAAAGFAFVPDARFIYGFAVLFGIGFGGVLSTGWALAIDTVPKMRDVARDLGVWGIAQNLPQVIAPIFGWWLLSAYGMSVAGYRLLFIAAAGSFAIGSSSVLAVRRRS
jgi:MFS family permease